MKASERLKIARNLINRANKHLNIVGGQLADILDEPEAYVFNQTDGFVVVHNGGEDNALLSFGDVDEMVKMSKEELERELNRIGI